MSFNGIPALEDVSLTVGFGEIRGLVGHNGSGKSTLMRIITGFYTPDAGTVSVGHGPGGTGIAAVHQEFCLSEDMTVTENLGITTGYGTGGLRPVRWKRQRRESMSSIGDLGMRTSPDALVRDLAPSERATVAIARAVDELKRSSGPGLLIVDEATAYFSLRESQRIQTLLRGLAERGRAVIFISHKLREVLSVCDSVTVLRNGRVQATRSTRDLSEDELISQMLGQPLGASRHHHSATGAQGHPGARAAALEVRDLADDHIKDFNLRVQPGTMVGITGLMGSGFERLPYLLVGSARRRSGTILVDGVPVPPRPRRAREAGLSLVPANRATQGVWMDGEATCNFTASTLRRYWRRGWLALSQEEADTRKAMQDFGVVPANPRLPLRAFSGGNQQKILISSRMRGAGLKVLLLHEPTQGVDSGAKLDIAREVQRASDGGAAIIVFSSDYEELITLCSLVHVMSTRGEVVSVLTTDALDEDTLAAACMSAG
jgi:ribose transport system ATP-binding protein